MSESLSRREFLAAAGGLAASGVTAGAGWPSTASAQAIAQTAAEAAAAMREAIGKVVGSARVTEGRVTLDLPPLVENGNTVPLAVHVESPMTQADHVKAIHIFTEKNPQPNVATFHLGPRAGRASVSTRARLANTQNVIAICEMSDGSFWSGRAEVVVTLGACLEDLNLI